MIKNFDFQTIFMTKMAESQHFHFENTQDLSLF